MRHKIEGNWSKGYAFDLHTVASTYLGPDNYGHQRWDNTRSEMGELIFQLKYRNNKSTIPKIIELLKALGGIETFDIIIPVPSSNKGRAYQPVNEVAKALGQQRDVEVLVNFLDKKPGGPEMKNIDDPDKRAAIMQSTIIIVGDKNISGKRVLLLDDVYMSGATLTECCSVLCNQAKAESVSVLTLTKTRSKR
jgi:predicted amidophosphoribosyltransferase